MTYLPAAALKKWIPAIKEQWSLLTANAEPYVQIVSAKTAEVYLVSKITASTYAVKVHKILDPYMKVNYKWRLNTVYPVP